MKRSLTLIILVIAMFSVCAFSVSAQQEYKNDELTFSVPDIMENDAAWAAQNNYTYAFYDTQGKIELCISVYENDGFSYVGMDDASLEEYASSLEDYFVQSGYTVESSDVKKYKLLNGYEGLEVTIVLANGEKGVFYWFTTDSMCYDFEFYVYDEAYNKYINEVMNTAAIVPAAEQGTVVVPPVTEEATNSDNGFLVDGEYNEVPTGTEEYPVDGADDKETITASRQGLTMELPGILKEDSDDGSYKMWSTADAGLFVELFTRPNSDDEIAVGFKDDDFQTLFNNIKSEDDSVKELIATENIKINGFKGVRLVYTAVLYGFEYEFNHNFFATKDTVYEVVVITGSDKYAEYVDSIINTVKIDGKAATNTGYYIYIAAIIALAVIRIVSKALKNKKAKKNNPGTNNTPNYFNPQTDAYGAQYDNQQTPNQSEGYVENNGYAPDYNYSNNLDTTLTNTNDFSKTEYNMATADMEKKYDGFEEE